MTYGTARMAGSVCCQGCLTQTTSRVHGSALPESSVAGAATAVSVRVIDRLSSPFSGLCRVQACAADGMGEEAKVPSLSG